jgi:hypothetical protein
MVVPLATARSSNLRKADADASCSPPRRRLDEFDEAWAAKPRFVFAGVRGDERLLVSCEAVVERSVAKPVRPITRLRPGLSFAAAA